MNRSDAGFVTLTTGAVVVYLLGALILCSAHDSAADTALTRGVGVAAGAAGVFFFFCLMRYLYVLTKERETSALPTRQGSA